MQNIVKKPLATWPGPISCIGLVVHPDILKGSHQDAASSWISVGNLQHFRSYEAPKARVLSCKGNNIQYVI